MWYSPDANVRLHAESGFGVVPGIPSVIATVNRVDQFLSNTGSFSGSFNGNFTGSLFGTSSYATNALTASYVLNAVSASFASTASSADNFLVRGTLTAQTIVAQTITSSTEFITGSTKFGSLSTDMHQFTGSVSISGSLTIPSLTPGSVIFAGTNGILSQSNSNLFWDNTNGRLGIGTITPSNPLQVNGAVRATSLIGSTSATIGGTGAANASAVIDLISTTKGLLPPRTDLTSNITIPVQGLITYLTGSTNEGLYYYTSGSIKTWTRVLNNTGSQSITGSLTATSFTGSLVGDLTGTASYATQALTASYVAYASSFPYTGSALITGSLGVTGSISIGSALLDFNQNTNVVTGSYQVIASEATASYRTAFFDYVIFSGSISRAGTIYTVWSGSTTEWYENYTSDIGGSTNGVQLQTAISSGNIQLQATASTAAWTIRSLVRML
jgi:hypothetical protein